MNDPALPAIYRRMGFREVAYYRTYVPPQEG